MGESKAYEQDIFLCIYCGLNATTLALQLFITISLGLSISSRELIQKESPMWILRKIIKARRDNPIKMDKEKV
jgi:hypothetical protein